MKLSPKRNASLIKSKQRLTAISNCATGEVSCGQNRGRNEMTNRTSRGRQSFSGGKFGGESTRGRGVDDAMRRRRGRRDVPFLIVNQSLALGTIPRVRTYGKHERSLPCTPKGRSRDLVCSRGNAISCC